MEAGQVVDGRFEIERLAGSGGMGNVYRALDRWTGEPVAVKVMHPSGAQELLRFGREIQAIATLRIPGVVRYIAHGLTPLRQPYLVMTWLSGETLARRLSSGPLTIGAALLLAARVASTLGAIHRLGVVHRDLKPSNLPLVGGEIEEVTLIDFGVVRVSGTEQQLTVPGVILGTSGYMSPEQARGEAQIDARADVFSLGCVLFKCLTGRAPFSGATALAMMAKVILEAPLPLRELRADVPEALEALSVRMMAKLPGDRPSDGAAVLEELSMLERREAPARPSPFPSDPRGTGITSGERKVMCLVLARDDTTLASSPRDDAGEVTVVSVLRAMGSALLGRVLLAQGRAAEALSAARAAFSEIEALGGEVEEGEPLVRLVHAQALARSGAVREFREAIAAARARVLERAARIRDSGWRERFLTGSPTMPRRWPWQRAPRRFDRGGPARACCSAMSDPRRETRPGGNAGREVPSWTHG